MKLESKTKKNKKNKKRFVLDTNVLLIDPHVINKLGKGNDVVIPMKVIEELDNFKKGSNELSRQARQCFRNINELLKSAKEAGERVHNDGAKLPTGGKLFVRLDNDITVDGPSLNTDYADNVILQTAINEVKNTKKQVILITKDIGLRIKAEASAVVVEDYENSMVEDISMYDEVPTIIISEQEMAQLFSNDEGLGVPIGPRKNILHNEYLYVKCTEDDDPQPVKYIDGSIYKLETGQAYGLTPRNLEQMLLLDALLDPEVQLVAAVGKAGTGKTLLAIAAALEQVVNTSYYKKVVIMRPIVSVGAEMGYLPGTMAEKLDPWLAPIYDNLEYLSSSPQASMAYFIDHEQLEVQAISHIRGRSIPNAFIIIDEVQNLNKHEIKTIVSRAGKDTKIVLTGDPGQIDNPYIDQYSNGLVHLINALRGENIFSYVSLTKGERSELAEMAANKL